MKKDFFFWVRNIFGVGIIGLLLYFLVEQAWCLSYLNRFVSSFFPEHESQSQNYTPVTSYNESSGNKSMDKTNSAISNRTFISDENGLYTVIKFEPTNEGSPVGAMMLSQNQCNYSFTYEINGTEIGTKFLNSSCGGNASSQTFYYNEAHDWITTNIGGQLYIFK